MGGLSALLLVGVGRRIADFCYRKQHLFLLRDQIILFKVWLSNWVFLFFFYWQTQHGAL